MPASSGWAREFLRSRRGTLLPVRVMSCACPAPLPEAERRLDPVEIAGPLARAVTFDGLPTILMLVNRHAESVRTQNREIFRFVRSRVTSPADAEDVTQEVFASAAQALEASASTAPPTLGWLYTVARRRLIDAARHRRVETVPLELVRDPEARADEYGGLVGRAFDAALAKLPEAQRRVVLMRLLEGRSFAEIGAELDAAEDACRMRFMRGLEKLRIEFKEEGLSP